MTDAAAPRRWLSWLRSRPYALTIWALAPLNACLAIIRAKAFVPGSVLHVSYMGHVPYYGVETLRAHGIRADYLAVGDSPVWNQADYRTRWSRWPFVAAYYEFRLLWSVVAKYEIVHAHFMVTMSRSGWELPILKRMGRKLVVHFRGCEIRDRERNMRLHPAVNICQECDYQPRPCEAPHNVLRRRLAHQYGDAWLVTTPDLKDFVPRAEHIPFFAPEQLPAVADLRQSGRPFRIVHATNHPGIEGSRFIVQAVESLRAKGHQVELVLLHGVSHARVLAELATADLSIGKLKMGYYANAQVESLVLGVPAVTFVRPEFVTPELEDSGLILTTLDALAATLEHYLTDPGAMAAKRAKARGSILRLHDNAAIARRMADIYAAVTARVH